MSRVSAQDLRAALQRLRSAGRRLRQRPARETLHALASVLESWREPDSPLRRALLIMDPEQEIMALVIPQRQIVIIAKPIKIVPFRELPFGQELLPFELPSLLEPE